MKNKQAFTLIELLVVVLIIGILAAVALPQYKMAVAKSRIVRVMAIAKSAYQAEEAYYMANGQYTQNWDEIAVAVAGEKVPHAPEVMQFSNGSCGLGTIGVSVSGGAGVTIYFFYSHAAHSFRGKTSCYATMSNDFANKVCQSLTHKKNPDSNNGPNTQNIYHF